LQSKFKIENIDLGEFFDIFKLKNDSEKYFKWFYLQIEKKITSKNFGEFVFHEPPFPMAPT
jgi:hypothetical protein